MNSSTGSARVLFVSHQATRTGAPLVLLHLVRWIREHTDIECEVLLLRDGPLRPDFEALAPVHRFHKANPTVTYVEKLEHGLVLADLRFLADWIRRIRHRARLRQVGSFDAIYLNSAASFGLAKYLPAGFDGAVIGHLHELEMGIVASLPRDGPLRDLLPRFDRVIACSEAVAAELVENHALPPGRMACHHEFIDDMAPPSEADVERVRAELKIPDDAAVIGNVATVEWRKGPELFLQMAAALRRLQPDRPIVFVWLGADSAHREFPFVEHHLRHAGLTEHVRFVPTVDDVRPYVALFDVLALTSREDPFPLACLEASVLDTPVVAFQGAGGIPELLLPDCGRVVEFADVHGMAETVVELLDHPDEARAMATRAGAKVRANHLAADVAPRIVEEIRAVLPSSS